MCWYFSNVPAGPKPGHWTVSSKSSSHVSVSCLSINSSDRNIHLYAFTYISLPIVGLRCLFNPPIVQGGTMDTPCSRRQASMTLRENPSSNGRWYYFIIFYCQLFYRFWFSIVKFGKIRYMFSLVWPASTWKLVRSTRSRWSWLQRRCFFLFLFCISRRWELAADISEFPICRTTPLVRCQSSSGSNSRRTTLLLTPEPKGLSRFGKLMDYWSTDWRG